MDCFWLAKLNPVIHSWEVYSGAVVDVEAFEVEIEVHAGWGNSDKIAVVGLPDTAGYLRC